MWQGVRGTDISAALPRSDVDEGRITTYQGLRTVGNDLAQGLVPRYQ